MLHRILGKIVILFVFISLGGCTVQGATTSGATPPPVDEYETLRYWLLHDKGHLTAEWGAEDCSNWGSLGDSCPNCGDCKHTGVDYGTSGKYEEVYAVASGRIVKIVGKTGQICIYNEPTNITFCYLHLSSFEITSGEVQQGELIGKTGKQGVNSIHLHFEARAGEKAYAACCYNDTINPIEAARNARGEAVTLTPPTETITPTVTATPIPVGRIAFVSDRDGNREIYLMELIGSTVVSLTNVTNNPADDYDPIWSPDGTRIAFVSERDGNSDIYMMNIKDSIIFRLTYDAGRESDVAWSPDGNRIMFVSDQEGNREIYMVNSDGSNHVNLTNNSDDDCCPSWSPDGKYILFIRGRLSLDDFPKSYIYLMQVDGATETFLYDYPPYNWGNSLWFPDGKQIALVAYPPGGEDPSAAFYIINIENPDISPSLIYIGHEFSLSPDFTSIATILPKNCDPYRDEKCEKGIFTMSIDGSSTNCLTCNNSGYDNRPEWSPDGNCIAFVSNRDVNKEIYLMDADGSNQVNLTNNLANDWGPVWAPIPIIYLNVSESTTEATNPPLSFSCPGALPTRLKAGGYAYVSLDPPLANRVRNEPGKNHSVDGSVQPGKIMEITDGPECADNWVWWKIRELETNLIGWTAEGDNQGYWLVPCASEIECGNH